VLVLVLLEEQRIEAREGKVGRSSCEKTTKSKRESVLFLFLPPALFQITVDPFVYLIEQHLNGVRERRANAEHEWMPISKRTTGYGG
jgi:hypothetical protein